MALMDDNIVGIERVQEVLAPLTAKQLDRLASMSGVPVTTIYKIKRGETTNPGIETVRKFLPHVQACLAEPAATVAA